MELKLIVKKLWSLAIIDTRYFWVTNYKRLFIYLLKLVIFTGLLLLILPFIIDKTINEKIVIIKDTQMVWVGHWILFFTYFLMAILRFVTKYKIDGKYILAFSYISAIYIGLFLFDDRFVALPENHSYKYLYSLGIIIVIENFLWFFPKKAIRQHDSFLLLDNPWKEGDADIYNFGDRAKALAKEIQISYSDKDSICIALTGKWGVGKTSFINMLELEFKDDSGIVTKKYSPWKSIGQLHITESFFQSIKESLSSYSPELASKLKTYSNALSSIDNSGALSVISNFINEEKSYETFLEEINQLLAKINKKLVIFIDDIDRLEYSEIMDVIKLIRNTANLHNTVFLRAFDKEYAFNAFIENKIDNPAEYFEKIFQFELSLNPFQNRSGSAYLFKELLKKYPIDERLFAFKLDNGKNVVDDIDLNGRQIFNLTKAIMEYLSTIRNAKRIYNSFCFAKELIGDRTLLDKLLILEITKLQNFKFYKLLIDLPKFKMGYINEFFVSSLLANGQEIVEHAIKTNIVHESQKDDYVSLVKFLERIDDVDNKYNFSEPNFCNYFEYFSTSELTIEMLNLIPKNSSSIIERLNNIKKGDPEQFKKLIKVVRDKFLFDLIKNGSVNWLDESMNYFQVILYIMDSSDFSIDEDFVSVLDHIVKSKSEDESLIIKGSFKALLISFDQYELNSTSFLFQKIILNYCYDSEYKCLISKEEAQQLAIENFAYIGTNNKAKYEDYEKALMCCVENVDLNSRKVQLMQIACESFKVYLVAYKNDFIKRLIRPVDLLGPTVFGATFFPYVLQIFYEKNELKNYIDKLERKDKWTILAKKYIDDYLSEKVQNRDLKQFVLNEEDVHIFYSNGKMKRPEEIYVD
ncbi:MAG: P-loop NTPase fold protein [Salinivirgaceae bacterium]